MKSQLSVLARISVALLLCAAALTGCVSSSQTAAFSSRFADNQERQTAAVVGRLPAPSADAAPHNGTGRALAVATTHGETRAVVAFDLESGRQLWSHPMEAMTRPEIVGNVIMTSDREDVVALDLANGAELWRSPMRSLAYQGAAREGDRLYYVVSVGASGGATRASVVRAVDARTGSEHWEYEIPAVLGQPAAQGGMVVVPWDRQNLAVLDGLTGVEVARLRSTDDVLSWVDATPAGIFYGSRGIYRLTTKAHAGTKAGSTYLPLAVEGAPGEPLVHDDGFLPKPGTRTARGRIRFYVGFAPTTDVDTVALTDDTIYFAYYRYVFAFNRDGGAKWVRLLDQDVVSAEVVQGGLVTVGERGKVVMLDAGNGTDRFTSDLATELASVSIDATGFAPSAQTPAGEAPSLRTALTGIAVDPDNRLVPARAFAIRLLGQIEDAEITRDLLDLYAQRSMPNGLREAIGTALRARRTGTDYLVEALRRHYDFLEGTQAPPLAIIVPSLLENHDARAVPGLIEHMMDHETPTDVLPVVVNAIDQLGDEQVVPALRAFLVLYHADSTFRPPAVAEGQEAPAHPASQALAFAAEGIFRHGGPTGRELLQQIIGDAKTSPQLAQHARSLFENEQRDAERRANEEEQARLAAERAAAQQAEAQVPTRLTQEQVNAVFAEHADDLRQCMLDEMNRNPRLAQVRVLFIINSDGSPRDFTFAPNTSEFVACMQTKVSQYRWPRFRQVRQRAQFTASLRTGTQQAATAQATDEVWNPNDPWWTRNARLAAAVPAAPMGTPWWVRRMPPAPTTAPENPSGTNGATTTGGTGTEGGATATNGQQGQGTGQQGQGTGQQGQGTGQQGQGNGQQGQGTGQQGQGTQGGEEPTPWWLPQE